jgi:hypothetical protein
MDKTYYVMGRLYTKMGATRSYLLKKGKSKATFIKLRNIVVQILKYCTDNDEDSVRQGAVKVIEGLESEFKESFLEVTTSKGYSTI